MKAESNIMPQSPFEIEYANNHAHIRFITNVERANQENDELENETEKYTYDEYTLTIRDRPGLEMSIENNYEQWLQIAIDTNETERLNKLRTKREPLLTAFDKWEKALLHSREEDDQNIMQWFEDLKDLKEETLKNVPERIKYYLS